MMRASADQKQTDTQQKSRRPVPGTLRQFFETPTNKRRLGLVGLSVIVGLGLPPLVMAAQNHLDVTVSSSSDTTPSQNNTSDAPPSSNAEEGFSTSVQTESDQSTGTAEVHIDSNQPVNATVNGQAVPMDNGSYTQTIDKNNSSSVDVNVSIDSSSSTSSSSSSSTNVSISSSSSSTDGSSRNNVRGSPRP